MAGTYTNLNYHLVFSTKHREPFIDDPQFELRLHEYLGGAVRGLEGTALLINGTQDHVHMLIRYVPNGNVSDLMRRIKSGSTRWVHDRFVERRKFAWQEGFGAFTVSHSQIDPVRDYIARQKEHHRTREFQPEFRGLLKAPGLEWDEAKIWL